MTFAIKELSKILTEVSPTGNSLSGVVVSASNGVAKIATSVGLISARYRGTMSPKDKVMVSNGFALKSITPSQSYSV